MSSAVPSSSLRNLFSELEQLFQTETEARVTTSVQAAERALSERLNQAARQLRQADGFSETAAILCDASLPFAAACGIFYVHKGTVSGERLRGAASPAAERFAGIQFAASEAAAFQNVIDSGEPVVTLASPAEVSPTVAELFAQISGDRSHLFPVTADQTVTGVLYARGVSDSAALELLAQAAGMSLEARQRPPRAARDASELVQLGPTPQADSEARWERLSVADRKLHLRAQHFARVQVAEMRLYRPDAVKAGRAQADLYATLRNEIDAAREAFRHAFVAASPTMADYFHQELLRTLANDNPAWLGKEYPGPLV